MTDVLLFCLGFLGALTVPFIILFFVDRWVTELTGYSPLKRRPHG